MVARGRVQNGVVVLEEGVRLPEGLDVTVHARETAPAAPSYSILDIPAVSLGTVLRTPTAEDDLLGEMLEDRR